MSTIYGYAGKMLRVDLSSGKLTDETPDEAILRQYLGGTGLGVKYLYDEVPPGVEWSDPKNRIIISSGPLGGTSIGGSGTISVVTKGPMTNGATSSQANGFFGAYLRFAGYDGIIIQGQARKWSYLYIHDGKAELKDASHLVGKDTYETEDAIKAELGLEGHSSSVACIGPAGENLARFACLMVDKGHAASHNGNGAVLGSKKLKAIAVARGKERPPFKDFETVSAVAKVLIDNIANHPVLKEGGPYKWGTLDGIKRSVIAKDGILPVKNYTTTVYDIDPVTLDKWDGPYLRSTTSPKPHPCWACRMHHCHMITINDGPYKGIELEEPEYEDFASFGPMIGNTEVTGALMLSRLCDGVGLDANEAAWVIGLVMECYEKGILSKKDCDGLEMKWGNVDGAAEILRKTATRQGIGKMLAEGTMRASRKIGGEAVNIGVYTLKGNTPRGHDHRNRWPMIVDTSVAQIGSDEGNSMMASAAEAMGITLKPVGANSSPEDILTFHVSHAQCKGAAHFEDCLGVCRFNTRTDLIQLSKALSAATGWDFPLTETMVVGKRIVNLMRVFNIRHGHTAEMDAPSPRYASIPVDGPSKGKGIMVYYDEMRRNFYKNMGWDEKTGIPLPDTLKKLDLEFAAADLKKK